MVVLGIFWGICCTLGSLCYIVGLVEVQRPSATQACGCWLQFGPNATNIDAIEPKPHEFHQPCVLQSFLAFEMFLFLLLAFLLAWAILMGSSWVVCPLARLIAQVELKVAVDGWFVTSLRSKGRFSGFVPASCRSGGRARAPDAITLPMVQGNIQFGWSQVKRGFIGSQDLACIQGSPVGEGACAVGNRLPASVRLEFLRVVEFDCCR